MLRQRLPRDALTKDRQPTIYKGAKGQRTQRASCRSGRLQNGPSRLMDRATGADTISAAFL